MPSQHVLHGDTISGVSRKRSHSLGKIYRSGIRLARHQRSDSPGPSSGFFGVVRQTQRHEHCAKVRVPKTQLTKISGCLADLFSRIVGVTDQDVLGRKHDSYRLTKTFYVESVSLVCAEEGKEVEACEVTCGVVEMNVFTAGVGRGDRTGVGSCMPAVDC